MRSDRDKRSDTEREIDDFLSKFENPADELSADINSYLNDKATTKVADSQTFQWKEIDTPDLDEDSAGSIDAPEASDAGAAPSPSAGSEEEAAPDEVADTDGSADDPDAAAQKAQDKAPENTEKEKKASEKKQKKASEKKQKTAAENAAAAKKSSKKEKAKKDKTKKKGGVKRFLFMRKNKAYDPTQGPTYEKDGKNIKNKEYKFSFLKLIADFAALGLICVLAGVIYFVSIVAAAPKYDYSDIYSAVDTASVIYNDEGKQIDNIFYTENRKVVKYSDMPEDLINAFIAIEDKTFWKHHGFNWTRMIGAILSSLTGSGRISGTSTITQQLARNVYLADIKSVRSIKRKLLEMYYANRIEHSLSKEEIIEAYLNTIYLGHGCYGVNAAARTYFSKSVKKLSLVECAALAALPQSPDTYALLKLGSEAQNVVDSKVVQTEPDTVVTNDIARERRQLTLDLMLAQNYITQAEHDKVYDLTLNEFIDPNLSSNSSIYSYFHEYLVDTVIADLMDQYGMEYEAAERMVYTKGLQIYSTVDTTAMKVIAKEFEDESNFPYVSAPRDADGNMLNNDGKIALYAYDNYFDSEGNFRLSGDEGDVKVNDDGSITIMSGHKLHIYETTVGEETDYSLEFKSYYQYDDEDVLYSISGGYLNIPMGYKSPDYEGNIVISKDYFEDPYYEGAIVIDGNDVILTQSSYTLSPRQRQPQAAMTIVGVGTGEVKAMVGGRQFGGQKVLNRSLNPRQPGSSIKPLAVYGAALQKSYDLAAEGKKWKIVDYKIDKQGTKGWGDYITVHSSIEDEKTKIEGRYWPNNFNNSFSGKNTFVTAIQKSINTCAVKLLLQIGSDYSIEQLKKFGLSTVQDDLSDPVNDANPAALALGAMTQGVEPLEMALAYAAFPAGGKVNTPICYYKVLDREGEVLLESKSTQTEALNEGVAWIMTDVLRSVVRANGYMYVEGFSPGGKTGTTNDQYDIWFDGFTPAYAGSLWIGTDENVEMSSMSTPAARLWGVIMDQIAKAKEGEYASMPSNVVQRGGEYFTTGTDTGLTSWSAEEEEKKLRQQAYQKWLKEREKHKKTIPAEYEYVDDLDKPIYEEQKVLVGYEQKTVVTQELVGYEQKEVTVPDETKPINDSEGRSPDDENWEPTYETKTYYEDDLDKPIYKDVETKVDDKDKPIYETQKVITGYKQKKVKVKDEEVVYEKGWREGDFTWKGKVYNGKGD